MACEQLRGKTFYSRDWIFSKILRCLDGEQSGGGVTLMGGPGTGKTAVCCEVVWPTSQQGKQAQLSPRLLAYYFLPPSTHKDTFSILLEFVLKIFDQVTKSPLLSNLECKSIDQVRLRQSPDDVFFACILKPLANLSLESSLFVLVDGLDDLRVIDKTEEFQSQSVSELLLKHRCSFPSWLKLVCTTRRHGKFFEGFRKIKLDDLRKSHVVRDVQQFILCRLDREDRLKQQLDRRTAEMLNQLHIKSDGCLLYLERSLDLVAQGFVPLQEIRDIPGTLNGFYLWLCQKLFSRVRFELVRPLLSVIYASESSVTAGELYDIVDSRYVDGMSRNDFNERLNTFRHIVLVERRPQNTAFVLDSYHRQVDDKEGDEVLTLDVFHHSFREWSLDVKYCTRRFLCRLSEGHASLGIYLISKGPSLNPKMVEHLAWHLSRSDFRLESYQLSLAVLYSGADLENCVLSTEVTLDTSVLEILMNAGISLSQTSQHDVMVSSFTGFLNGNPLDFLSDDEEGDVSASSSSAPASSARSPLACAAFQGNLQLVQLLVDAADSEMLEKTDPKTGQTPLMLAARYGHHEIVAVLVSAGAQLNRVDSDGWTALKSASWGGHVECVKHLVESGAEVNRCDTGGRTPLSAAAWCGHEEVVKLLIEFGGIVDWQDHEGRTSLMSASYLGHQGIVQLLLSFGADPNLTDPDSRTALFVACSGVGKSSSERLKVLELLLEAGADVTLVDVDGLAALTVAACEGRQELCELLLENDADVDWEDVEGRTAIDWAVMMGRAEVVKTLLFWGACVDAIDPDGRTLLGNAAQQGNSEVVRLLLDRGLDEMHRDNYGWTSLHVAAFEGQTEVVQVLLEAGTHANEQDNEGRTPLFLAAQEGHVAILALLCESAPGCSDCKTHDLRTPLMITGALNRETAFRFLLLELNSDPRKRDAFGRNVLHWIALENCGSDVDAYKLIKLVLDEYPEFDLDVADDEGQTALHCCSWLGRTGLCELLLSRGANPNPIDLESRTPLILAAWQDQSECVEMLLKYGGRVNHRARDGATALAVAFQERHECVIKVLLSHCRATERQKSLKDMRQWEVKGDELEERERLVPLPLGEHKSKEAESSLVRYSKPSKLPGQKKISRNVSGVASDREADVPLSSKMSGLSRGSLVAERAFSDGSNPRIAAGDTPTTTTTTSGVSSMEMTFSNSLAACGPVVSGSSAALGRSGNLLSASDQDVDAPNAKSGASRSERSSSSCGIGRGQEVESSGSSGDVAGPSKKEQTTQTSGQPPTRSTALGDSSGSGIDFARELDRLSNPRNRSFRGPGYSSNYLGASSGTAHSTSDSNVSLSSDKRSVTRRPNKKKREQASGAQEKCRRCRQFERKVI